jgi:hypothetical protein
MLASFTSVRRLLRHWLHADLVNTVLDQLEFCTPVALSSSGDWWIYESGQWRQSGQWRHRGCAPWVREHFAEYTYYERTSGSVTVIGVDNVMISSALRMVNGGRRINYSDLDLLVCERRRTSDPHIGFDKITQHKQGYLTCKNRHVSFLDCYLKATDSFVAKHAILDIAGWPEASILTIASKHELYVVRHYNGVWTEMPVISLITPFRACGRHVFSDNTCFVLVGLEDHTAEIYISHENGWFTIRKCFYIDPGHLFNVQIIPVGAGTVLVTVESVGVADRSNILVIVDATSGQHRIVLSNAKTIGTLQLSDSELLIHQVHDRSRRLIKVTVQNADKTGPSQARFVYDPVKLGNALVTFEPQDSILPSAEFFGRWYHDHRTSQHSFLRAMPDMPVL